MQTGGEESPTNGAPNSCFLILSRLYTEQYFIHLALLLVALLLVGSVLLSSSKGAAAGAHGRRRKKLPPGSLGLPLGIGETLQFAFYNTCAIGCPPPFLSSRLRKYGTVFKTHLIGCPSVVSMDPELNKLLLSNEEKLVQVNFPNFIKKIVGPVLTVHGARHRRLRELATSILSPAAIQAHHLIPIQGYALSVLRPWLHMPIVDAQHESKKFIFTYIARTLLSLAPEDPKTESLMRDFLFLMNGYSALPLNLPGTTYNKVLKARERITTIISRLLRDRTKVATSEHKDFLDILLKETDECGKHFSEQDIVDFMFFLVLGGFETTSILLTNVMKFLSENAHVVDELRKEHTVIRKTKKANEMLTWDDFKQMKFTEYVIKESLRMASIVHYVMREAIQDIVFRDMVIPKGWTILISFAMVHLNPSYYKNPLKFDPWRWKETENNSQAFLMPFGGGTRSCLGSFLAKFEVSIFIHYLVTSYKWSRIVEVDGQRDEVSSLSFPSMRNGLRIQVQSLQAPSD